MNLINLALAPCACVIHKEPYDMGAAGIRDKTVRPGLNCMMMYICMSMSVMAVLINIQVIVTTPDSLQFDPMFVEAEVGTDLDLPLLLLARIDGGELNVCVLYWLSDYYYFNLCSCYRNSTIF